MIRWQTPRSAGRFWPNWTIFRRWEPGTRRFHPPEPGSHLPHPKERGSSLPAVGTQAVVANPGAVGNQEAVRATALEPAVPQAPVPALHPEEAVRLGTALPWAAAREAAAPAPAVVHSLGVVGAARPDCAAGRCPRSNPYTRLP